MSSRAWRRMYRAFIAATNTIACRFPGSPCCPILLHILGHVTSNVKPFTLHASPAWLSCVLVGDVSWLLLLQVDRAARALQCLTRSPAYRFVQNQPLVPYVPSTRRGRGSTCRTKRSSTQQRRRCPEQGKLP